MRAAFLRSVKDVDGVVWIGKDDHVLRKAHVTGKMVVAKADRKTLLGRTSGTLDATLNISEVGEPQEISAPTAARLLCGPAGRAERARRGCRHPTLGGARAGRHEVRGDPAGLAVGLVERLERPHAGRRQRVERPLDDVRMPRKPSRRAGTRAPRSRWRRSARTAPCRPPSPRRARGRGTGTPRGRRARTSARRPPRGPGAAPGRRRGRGGAARRRSGRAMSGWPRCASAAPSMSVIMLWTIDCGCTTTSMRSYGIAEQVVGLDDLQALVHERRRVDRDLAAHVPRRVLQRVLDADVLELGARAPAEGAARRGQDELLDASPAARPRSAGAAPSARSRRAGSARRSPRRAPSRARRRRRATPCWRARGRCPRRASRRSGRGPPSRRAR